MVVLIMGFGISLTGNGAMFHILDFSIPFHSPSLSIFFGRRPGLSEVSSS